MMCVVAWRGTDVGEEREATTWLLGLLPLAAPRRTVLKGGQRRSCLRRRLHQLDAAALQAEGELEYGGGGGGAIQPYWRCIMAQHSKQRPFASSKLHVTGDCNVSATPVPRLTAVVQLDDESLLVLALVGCNGYSGQAWAGWASKASGRG